MTTERFERQISHLDQSEVLAGAISSLNKLLVDKKLVHEEELQTYFLKWMRSREHGKGKRRNKRSRQ